MTTDDRTLDARYLDWLYKQVAPLKNRNPSTSYWLLANALFKKEFIWFVPNDDNRVADGRELREEFIDETAAERDALWMDEECSMLEMLIALSRRLSFETDEPALEWFWVMIDNLELRPFVDSEFSDDFLEDVEIVLERVNARTYDAHGRGGIFPLRHPEEDQREIEIWYQMAAYLKEHN